MVKKIRKRDGSVVFFQADKIEDAIWKAVRAVGGKDRERVKVIANKVVEKLDRIHGEHGIADVEDVQDLIEKVLIEEGHAKVGKAFILYRKSREDLRDVKGLFDTIEAVEDYIGLNDWMVKENSNMGYSLQGLNNYIATKIVSNYWMRRIYPEAVRKVHESGDLHVHDLGTLGAYCVGWDLKDLLMVGFKGVKGKVESKPAKHLRTALGQMVNFFYTLQGESAGAQAFSNFDTLLAPFIRYDGLDYKQVKQSMQEFVFNMAVPTRVGFQTPFTNITMDLEVPSYMANEYVVIGGELKMDKYGDFQKEMDMINRAFAECMLEGDASGQVFTFPIPTYNITKDFDFEKPEYDLIWEMTAKYGIPYFSNFVNSDMKPEDSRSMCCRLRIDNTELKKRGGGLFGANPLTGSIGVVTINMARLGYVSTGEDDFFARLESLMELSKESLEIKRKSIEKFTEMGLYPYSKFYLRAVYDRFGQYWKNHFGTIGLLGMNEAVKNFMPGEDITTEKGRVFALRVLDFMRDKLGGYQEETGSIYNLEATPGEGTTYRFARMDKKRFGRIIVANEEAVQNLGAKPYYTNSSQLPVDFTDDVFEALDLQDELQCKYTGGTVFHTFVGERMTVDAVKRMVKKIAFGYHLPYFTISPTFSICPIHGYLSGEHEYCPKCDLEVAEGKREAEDVLVEEDKLEVSEEEIALAGKISSDAKAKVMELKDVVRRETSSRKIVSAFDDRGKGRGEVLETRRESEDDVESFEVVEESKIKSRGDIDG
ncbi:ribonucleoside triphosphate reductase [Candidatus Pacearchaeota archaeon]|nr:ribonucleoside triphosphate reductase [Candidatus Pacearchaeota archaeon]